MYCIWFIICSQTTHSILLRLSSQTPLHFTINPLLSLFLSSFLSFCSRPGHCFHLILSGVLHENLLPILKTRSKLSKLVWSIKNSILASIIWLRCGLVAGELLTYWHSDNDSSVWAALLLPCLFPCLSPSLLRSLSASVCVFPKFHSFCLRLSLYDFLTVCLLFFSCFSMSVFVSFVGIPLSFFLSFCGFLCLLHSTWC